MKSCGGFFLNVCDRIYGFRSHALTLNVMMVKETV